jgi:hypothetical protein
VLKLSCWQGHALSRGSIGESVPCLFQFGVTASTLRLVLELSNLFLQVHIDFRSPVSLISTCVMEFWTHPNNPEYSHLSTTKTFCLNKETFTGSRD